jgi:hypothetical protein
MCEEYKTHEMSKFVKAHQKTCLFMVLGSFLKVKEWSTLSKEKKCE